MRRVSIAMAAWASVLLTACSSAAPSGSPTATPTGATPTGTVEPSLSLAPSLAPSLPPTASPPQATASGDVLAGFAQNDILRVEVNGLAVRVKPYTDLPLATGSTFDGAKWNTIGPLRLNVGDFVSADLGPVKIGDTTWYRVSPAEGGRLHYSTVSWDTNGTIDGSTEPAWVASSVGAHVYLTLHEASQPEPWLSGLPLLVSGVGDYVSGPLQSTDLFTLNWVYLIDDQSAPCDFRVTLAAVAGGEELVAVDTSTLGAFEEGGVVLGTGDGVPVVGNVSQPFQVRVKSGCEWSLVLEPQAHD
jgi:hypothetical protein